MSDLDYRAELPSDPGAGFGGVAPRPRALTGRLILALLFVLACAAGACASALAAVPSAAVVLVVLAVFGLVAVGTLVRRRRRGEPA